MAGQPLLGSTWSRSFALARSNPQPADAEARGFPEHAFASQDRTGVIPGGTGGTGGTAANSQTFGGTERWDRWDCHGRLPIRVESPGRIGPTCQYHLFAPIPVEYHRSHPSPPKKLSREMKIELGIMT